MSVFQCWDYQLSITQCVAVNFSPNSDISSIRFLLRPYRHNQQYNNWRRYINNISIDHSGARIFFFIIELLGFTRCIRRSVIKISDKVRTKFGLPAQVQNHKYTVTLIKFQGKLELLIFLQVEVCLHKSGTPPLLCTQ